MKKGGKEWWVGNLKGGVVVEEGGTGDEAIGGGGGCCRSEFGSGFLSSGLNRDSLSHLQRSFMHI